MSSDTDEPDTEDRNASDFDGATRIRIPGLELTDEHRITIPARFRDRFDITEDDVVDVFLEREEGGDVTALDLSVDSSGRVRIPSRKRDIYDIEPHEIVDVTVRKTGMRAE